MIYAVFITIGVLWMEMRRWRRKCADLQEEIKKWSEENQALHEDLYDRNWKAKQEMSRRTALDIYKALNPVFQCIVETYRAGYPVDPPDPELKRAVGPAVQSLNWLIAQLQKSERELYELKVARAKESGKAAPIFMPAVTQIPEEVQP